MTRSKRHSHTRHSTPARLSSRIYPHTPPMRSVPHYQRHQYLKEKHGRKSHYRKEDSDDSSFLGGIYDAEDKEDEGPDGSEIDVDDTSSDDQGWDNENVLIEMLGSPEYKGEDVLHALSRAFADASQGLREEVVLGILPVLRSAREARPAPGRAFITGVLGFDDECKRFEENVHRSAELDAAYAKIELDIGGLFERLRGAYSRLEEKRAVFQKQVKEKANKMREIVNTLPADVDALLEKLEKKYKDIRVNDSNGTKKKGRERTVEGALAELRL